MFGLVYSPWERVTTSHHGSRVPLFLLLTETVLFLSERYPENSIVGVSKDTKESTVPVIIIIIIIFLILLLLLFLLLLLLLTISSGTFI